MNYPPTIVIRHTRENLKKCSLRGLEGRKDVLFFTYPDCALAKEHLPPLDNYLLMDLEGEPLSAQDAHMGLILLDATWRLAGKIYAQTSELHGVPKRSMPVGFKTAYPRRQEDCPDPSSGLASIEALYIAYRLLGHDAEPLLEGYHWKEQFLAANAALF